VHSCIPIVLNLTIHQHILIRIEFEIRKYLIVSRPVPIRSDYHILVLTSFLLTDAARVIGMPKVVYAGLTRPVKLSCPSLAEPPVNGVTWIKDGRKLYPVGEIFHVQKCLSCVMLHSRLDDRTVNACVLCEEGLKLYPVQAKCYTALQRFATASGPVYTWRTLPA